MKLLSKLLIISCLVFNTVNALEVEETIELNFVNTPISHLTQLVSEVTGNNFVSDGTIPGNFTFVSQKPVKKKNLISIYEMILRTKGFMIVNHEDKGFFMIKRNTNARKENIEFDISENNNEIKTEVINLEYFKPTKIQPIIKPYFTNAGKVVANDQLGFIMLTDYHDSIQKIKSIIKKIDTPTNLKMHWVKLENVNTKNVFKQIQQLSKLISTQFRKPITVIEDKSTNSIIISCEGDEYKVVEKLINKIDNESHMSLVSEVIYLKNSKSTELVKIVTAMNKERYERGDIKDSEKVAISHDVSLNAIILMGERSILNGYKSIINNLDKPKKQVYVEAQIIEINEDKAKELGVKLDNLIAGGAGVSGAWAASVNMGQDGLPTLLSLQGLSEGIADKIDTVSKGISVGAAIKLLQENGASKILSSPKLLCLDNQESSIYVGKVSPIKTTEAIMTDSKTIPASYNYKDIGLTLKIKPQIMSDGKVRLDILTKLEDIINESSVEGNLPTTTKREIKTTSIVNDGDDIVIAGLIRDKKTNIKSQVPLLGDIPFLGALFRSKATSSERVNLLVILTPTVISDVKDLPSKSILIKNKIIPKEFIKKDKKILENKDVKKKVLSQDDINKQNHNKRLKAMGI